MGEEKFEEGGGKGIGKRVRRGREEGRDGEDS